jgi:DNA-binding NarL/FixJ family response regulator
MFGLPQERNVTPPTIRLVLADAHPVVLDGLRSQLQASPDMQVQACVHNTRAALDAVREHQPDCLVMELDFPGHEAESLIAQMQSEGWRTQPVLFTSAPPEQLVQALDLGVRGLVSKQRPHAMLVDCIRHVHAGQTWLDQTLASQTMALLLHRQQGRKQAVHGLTPREVDVARMVTEGWPNKKIASKLSISEGTAKLHLHHIYQKLNCPGRMALMLYMQRHGFV